MTDDLPPISLCYVRPSEDDNAVVLCLLDDGELNFKALDPDKAIKLAYDMLGMAFRQKGMFRT